MSEKRKLFRLVLILCIVVGGIYFLYRFYIPERRQNFQPKLGHGEIKFEGFVPHGDTTPTEKALLESHGIKTRNSADSPISSSPIATWKTYRNDQYGFEVGYPGDWMPEIKADTIFFDEQGNHAWSGQWSVSIHPSAGNVSLSQWILDNSPTDPTGGRLMKEESDTTLGLLTK